MKTQLNQRFQVVINFLLSENPGLKKGDIAEKLGISSQTFSGILKYKQLPTLEVLSNLFYKYGISKDYIFEGKLPIKKGETPASKPTLSPDSPEFKALALSLKGHSASQNASPTASPEAKKQGKIYDLKEKNKQNSAGLVQEPGAVYNLGLPKVITVNERKEENITFVPVKARAGYLTGYGDPEFVATLPTYRLPGLDNGTYRMFEAEGPSMAPNIMHGDRVIGQWLSSLDEIRENRVHIIVTHEEGVIVKRILNRIHQRGKIVIKSDTVHHRREFPTFDIDPENILEIWYCRLKLSSDFSEPSEVYHRLADLEADMTEVKQILTTFHK